MKRFAAIDIGTNSVLLLIAESSASGALQAIDDRCTITRIGEGVDATRRLAPAAIARTLSALEAYRRAIDAAGAGLPLVVGTSALRDAENRDDFLLPAERVLGTPIRSVSGEREAELVLAGVATSLPLVGQTVVFDVGGGSTELIAAGQAEGSASVQSRARTSLDIGSVRLTERLLHGDPPGPDELEAVRRTLAEALGAAAQTPVFSRPAQLVGVAGTVTTLLAIELEMAVYEAARVDGAWLSRGQVDALVERLAGLPLAERRRLVGLEPERADVIVAGALVVSSVLAHFSASGLRVSDRGVRWGLVAEADAP